MKNFKIDINDDIRKMLIILLPVIMLIMYYAVSSVFSYGIAVTFIEVCWVILLSYKV